MARWTPAPIVGGAYSDDTMAWNHQDTVNYIPVQTERPNGRSEWKLVSAPGFYMVADTGSKAPIRGMRNVEGTLLVVSGTKLYKVSPKFVVTAIGTIPGVLRVSMAHNQVAGGNQVAISNGQSGYVYSTVDNSLVQITDDGFPGASSFDFVDGYITGIDPGRNFAFTSDLADALAYSELDRYQAEGSPDKLVGQIVDHREWWLFGERTIEPFQNTGSATGTFQRSGGTVIDVGAASTHAIVKMDNSVFWLGSDGVVYRANGYTPVRISTFPIEQAIARSTMSSAFAFTFEDRGHKIFYLTFQDGQTWGYDVATQEWHRRESRGLGRWRINDLVQWNGMWIAGDFTNGKLYKLDWTVMNEDGDVMERRRVTGVLHDSQNAVIVNALALVIDTGLPEVDAPLAFYGDAPNGNVGMSYTYGGYRVVGGTKPYAVSMVAGSLPPGLVLAAGGLSITGTPTIDGTFSFTLQAKDERGRTARLADQITVLVGQIVTPTSSYRILEVPYGDATDYSSPDFDDSSWRLGQTPAANSIPHPYAGTEGWPQEQNFVWGGGDKIWLRSTFTMASPKALVFEVFVDNWATVWVNGAIVLPRSGSSDQPSGTVFNHVVNIPASMLHAGSNSIVVLGEDDGSYSYLACKMSAVE